MTDTGIHAVTVDLEDWYHVCGVTLPSDIHASSTIFEATDRLLGLLRRHAVRATFFVLGSVAARFPELLPLIAAEGHELASHGWSHRLVTNLSSDEFREELESTADLIYQQTGQRPKGFRAPRWSLCRINTAWAFDILAESGYSYDSSLTPLAFIGDPGGSRFPHNIKTCSGNILEIPPMVTSSPAGNLPTGGGWGFRFFPLWLINRTLKKHTEQGMPGVLFIHPRELYPEGPRLRLGALQQFIVYGPRSSSSRRLDYLLSRFKFKPLGEIVASWQSAS